MSTESGMLLLGSSLPHNQNHRWSCTSVLRQHGNNSQSLFHADVLLHISLLKQKQITLLVNSAVLQGDYIKVKKGSEYGMQSNDSKALPSHSGSCPFHSPDASHWSPLDPLKRNPFSQANSQDEFQAKLPEGWEQLRKPWVGACSIPHSTTRNAIELLELQYSEI